MDKQMVNSITKDKAILMAAFARVDPVALAVALGSIFGLMLFIATAVLLVKGMWVGGRPGPHLALIGIYLFGYEVSWMGAILGAAYLWTIGAVVGFILATFWNMTHHLYIAAIVIRVMWWKMMAD